VPGGILPHCRPSEGQLGSPPNYGVALFFARCLLTLKPLSFIRIRPALFLDGFGWFFFLFGLIGKRATGRRSFSHLSKGFFLPHRALFFEAVKSQELAFSPEATDSSSVFFPKPGSSDTPSAWPPLFLLSLFGMKSSWSCFFPIVLRPTRLLHGWLFLFLRFPSQFIETRRVIGCSPPSIAYAQPFSL